MTEKKEQQRQEFKQVFSSFFREMWMNLFQETITNLLLSLVKKHIDIPGDESNRLKIDAAVKTLNELMPLVPLLGALKNFGRPKSLVFINEAGQAIDLLEVKEINENEMFNQVLDNMGKSGISKLNEEEAGHIAEQFKSKINR